MKLINIRNVPLTVVKLPNGEMPIKFIYWDEDTGVNYLCSTIQETQCCGSLEIAGVIYQRKYLESILRQSKVGIIKWHGNGTCFSWDIRGGQEKIKEDIIYLNVKYKGVFKLTHTQLAEDEQLFTLTILNEEKYLEFLGSSL